jgi:hypothetical protein
LIISAYAVYNALVKRLLKFSLMMCTACFVLHGCVYNCACDENIPERPQTPASKPIPKGAQLLSECTYINETIADSVAFSKKMANSRYAIYYQAMSRERVSELQARAKHISCP